MNVTDPIRRHARMTPYMTALLRPDGQVLSYRDFDRAIDFVAHRVASYGLQPGDYAGHYFSDLSQTIVFAMAFARLGIVGAPPSMPQGMLKAYFAEPGSSNASVARNVVVDAEWWRVPSDGSVKPVPAHPGGSAPCRTFASSGTTGVEKHCVLSHDTLVRRAHTKWLALPGTEAARTIVYVVPMTQYGYFNLLRIFMSGTTAVVPMRTEEVVLCIARYRVANLIISPLALQLVLDGLPPDFTTLPSLRLLEVGGSLLPNRLYEQARQRLCSNVHIVYGAMETGGMAEVHKGLVQDTPGAVGYIYPGVEVEAVDEHNVPLPPGEEGILRVRSPICATAYVGDPARSAEVFRDGWVYPGDVGTVMPDRLLVLGSRASEIINTGGNKINPLVIEEVLLRFAQIRECAAFGAPDATGLERAWAAIVTDGSVDMAALRRHCDDALGTRAPTYFLRVAQLPRNANGKIVREDLRALAQRQLATAPGTLQ
jgi:acyl-coenzyme A synthetase/AMP-(fatty) acid ligase